MNKHKRRKLVKNKKSKSQLAIATASNQESESVCFQIFKLDVDFVQEIFDYLIFKDILTILPEVKAFGYILLRQTYAQMRLQPPVLY